MPSLGAKNGIFQAIGFLRILKMIEQSNFKDSTSQYSMRTRKSEKRLRKTSLSTDVSKFLRATRHMSGGLKLSAG